MDKGKPTLALCIFLLLFLLTPVSPICKKFTGDECKAAHPVAGLKWIGLGFNIMNMESTNNKVVDIDLTIEKDGSCNLCTSTSLDRIPPQILPVAVLEWNITNDCKPAVSAALVRSVYHLAVKNEQIVYGSWEDLGLPPHIPPSLTDRYIYKGAHSASIKFIQKQSEEERNQYFRHEVVCKKYSFKLIQTPPLTAEFKASIDDLPQDLNAGTVSQFHHLIHTYGTHYVTAGVLGGRLISVSGVKTCEMTLKGFTDGEVFQCLTDQISTNIGVASSGIKSNAVRCKETHKMKDGGLKRFCRTFNIGGNQTVNMCPGTGSVDRFKNWLASLNTAPGLIVYALRPIYTLVTEQQQRRALENVLHKYIQDRLMRIRCTNNCASGLSYEPDATHDCACSCGAGITNLQCCSHQLGLSTLTLWIDRAHNLRGDWFSQADAGINVEFQRIQRRTSTVWNNNNPVFNARYDLGIVHLAHKAKIIISVREWNPFPWGEVITDVCETDVGAGPVQTKVCNLKQGHLVYRYQAVCGPYLSGGQCRDYVSVKPTHSVTLGKW